MAVQSLSTSEHAGHPWGDVLALFLVAAALALLIPRREAAIAVALRLQEWTSPSMYSITR
jgi:hypothetical protein